MSSDADDSDVDIIEVIDKSVDNTKTLKLEKIDALKKIDPNPSFAIDPIVPLSSSPFVSSDAADSDVEIIEVIDKSVDNTKTLKLEKMDSLKERDPNTPFDMVIDRDHPVPFNLKNPSAAELFRVLLLYPSTFEVRSPLKRCRENKMYTIKNFQISEIKCDDNGSYKDSNTVKTKYYVHIDENDDVFVRGVHQINGRYYYKERNGRQYFVPMENIYILDRYYRTNKSIEQLKMMVVRIELMESEVPLPYSCVIYSLDDEGPDDVTEIKCVSHGNNKKAELSQPYIRTSKSVFQEMDTLLDQEKSSDVFDLLLENSGGPMFSSSISTEPRNYKQVLNRQNIKRQKVTHTKQDNPNPNPSIYKDNLQKLLAAQRDPKSLIRSGDSYLAFLYTDKQLQDIEQFCCGDNDVSVLGIDTTFKL